MPASSDPEKSKELTARVLPERPPTVTPRNLPLPAPDADTPPAAVAVIRAPGRGALFWTVVGLSIAIAVSGAVLFGIYFASDSGTERAPAPPQVAPSKRTQPVPGPPTAAAEAPEAPTPAASTGGPQAVVTSLPKPAIAKQVKSPPPGHGTVTIRSSKPGEVVHYPERKVIGKTPLLDFPLPAGRHKFKVVTGSGRSGKKYFILEVPEGDNIEKTLDHWR
jgi:hypothetical protein